MKCKTLQVFLLQIMLLISWDVMAQDQRVTIHLEQVKIQEVFKEINKQTGLDFVYSAMQLNEIGMVSLDVKDVTVEVALKKLFEGKPFTCKFEMKSIIIRKVETVTAGKTSRTIRGVITDKSNEPLPGVTVLLKGTSVGTASNTKGEFVLEVTGSVDSLVVTFVGMKTQYVKLLPDKDSYRIRMEYDVEEMQEVVVTGYQTINRKRSTGAITSVNADKIMRPGVLSIDQMLEGQIPDMMFMSNSGEVGVVPKIRIRGTSTLIGNREPLWVVDGIVLQDPVNISPEELNNPDYVNRIGNAIAGLNPQDIERLDILKDAAATALYGAKAANGVIVITTKKGHIGKPIISYNMNVSYKRRPRYTDRQIDLMNSKERMEFSKDLVDSGYTFPGGMNMVGYEGLINQLYRGALTYDEFTKQVQYLECLNTDWFDLLTEDAFSHQHTVSISGGTETVRYYSSVGYAKDNDVIKGNNNERYTVALNLNADLSPRISTSLGINGNVTSREYSQDEIAPLDYAYNTSRTIPAFDENGDYYYYQNSGGTANSFRYNILNELENSSYDQEGSSISFNMTLNVKFTNYLNASVVGSYSTSNTDIEGWWGEKSHHVALLRQSEYGDAPAKGDDSESALPFGGELTTNSTRNRNYMLRVQLNLDKYFGQDKHNVNASVGYEVSSTKYKGNSSTMRGYYKDRGKQFSITTLNDYPAFKAWLEANAYPTISDNLTNLLSAYATVSYSYQSFFTLNGNVRFDGSNKFGDQSNDKLLPIWSISGNYTISEHEWLQRNWIDYIMLKASFGYQGNMLEGQSPTMIIKQLPTDPLYNELVSELSVYPNPNLKWEKTSSFNGGLTFSLFKRRLQMETSVYYKRTKDAFLTKQISTVNGLEEYVVNSGDVKNSGYSIAATIIPVETRDFNWILATSFSNVFNKMETLPGAEQFELNNFLNGTALVKGKPVGTFYSYKFVGLNPTNGYPIFDDMQERQEELEGLTKYDVYTRVLKATGNREPTMSGSINNTLRYKNWRLNMNLAYSLGSKVRLFKLFDSNTFLPENNVRREFVKRWRKTGDEKNTVIPAPNCYLTHYSSSGEKLPTIANNSLDMYNYSDIRVVSGNYLKCSTMSLTYEFPMEKLERIKLSRLALNLSATNLFTICSNKLKGQAPQQSGFAEIQLTDRPTYTVGVSVSF
ncbi:MULTISPECIES: SusC/RagA family TonB-linked outer membrane protein [Butyricimonas]|uniref:TonB-linked SusC/RagA family outer membrane protein n=1 Tax=Butyricimonas paravirosa TaxID=1472417 RepID=A0A7X6BKZ6_9BACT|nr:MULTISPECIES: SusC/RagA family TonB-linked outer membrane protein [Odoribacteraceae]NJC19287.1 TonB-linked SusC/RagA family outer membrane protein [Butyricimonas paravirosa]